jgi:hypothetical protein
MTLLRPTYAREGEKVPPKLVEVGTTNQRVVVLLQLTKAEDAAEGEADADAEEAKSHRKLMKHK